MTNVFSSADHHRTMNVLRDNQQGSVKGRRFDSEERVFLWKSLTEKSRDRASGNMRLVCGVRLMTADRSHDRYRFVGEEGEGEEGEEGEGRRREGRGGRGGEGRREEMGRGGGGRGEKGGGEGRGGVEGREGEDKRRGRNSGGVVGREGETLTTCTHASVPIMRTSAP